MKSDQVYCCPLSTVWRLTDLEYFDKYDKDSSRTNFLINVSSYLLNVLITTKGLHQGISSTYDLVLDVAVELVNFSGRHQEVPAAPQWLQQLLELPLHQLPPPVNLVSVLHLLPERLHLALQLHHLPLTHLHLVLQHLWGGGESDSDYCY